MEGKAGLILQGHICDEVQVESSDSQERIARIVRKTCFKF